MTREEILDYFKDINFMYNNPSMFDTLKRMLDELTEPCEDELDFVQPHKRIPVTLDLNNSCADAVNRDDALLALTGEIPDGMTVEEYIARASKRLRALPSVQPTMPTMVYPQVPGVTPCVVPDYKDGWRLNT